MSGHKCGDRVQWKDVPGVGTGAGMCIGEDSTACLVRSDRIRAIHEGWVEHYLIRFSPGHLEPEQVKV